MTKTKTKNKRSKSEKSTSQTLQTKSKTRIVLAKQLVVSSHKLHSRNYLSSAKRRRARKSNPPLAP